MPRKKSQPSQSTIVTSLDEKQVGDYLLGVLHRKELGCTVRSYSKNPYYKAGFEGTPIGQVFSSL